MSKKDHQKKTKQKKKKAPEGVSPSAENVDRHLTPYECRELTRLYNHLVSAIKENPSSSKKRESLNDLTNKLRSIHSLCVQAPDDPALHVFSVQPFPSLNELILNRVPPSMVQDIYHLRQHLYRLEIVNSGIPELIKVLVPIKFKYWRGFKPMRFGTGNDIMTLSPRSNASGADNISQVRSCDNAYESHCWTQLTHLRLCNCGIARLDPSFHFLPHLKQLDLSHNDISGVIHLQDCTGLVLLNLSHNRIQVLSNLQHVIPNIQKLNLSHNSIAMLDGISQLHKLTKLDLSYNMLDDIHEVEQLVVLEDLEELFLSGNPISNASVSTTAQSSQQIKKYRCEIFGLFLHECALAQRPPPLLDGLEISSQEEFSIKSSIFLPPDLESASFTNSSEDGHCSSADKDSTSTCKDVHNSSYVPSTPRRSFSANIFCSEASALSPRGKLNKVDRAGTERVPPPMPNKVLGADLSRFDENCSVTTRSVSFASSNSQSENLNHANYSALPSRIDPTKYRSRNAEGKPCNREDVYSMVLKARDDERQFITRAMAVIRDDSELSGIDAPNSFQISTNIPPIENECSENESPLFSSSKTIGSNQADTLLSLPSNTAQDIHQSIIFPNDDSLQDIFSPVSDNFKESESNGSLSQSIESSFSIHDDSEPIVTRSHRSNAGGISLLDEKAILSALKLDCSSEDVIYDDSHAIAEDHKHRTCNEQKSELSNCIGADDRDTDDVDNEKYNEIETESEQLVSIREDVNELPVLTEESTKDISIINEMKDENENVDCSSQSCEESEDSINKNDMYDEMLRSDDVSTEIFQDESQILCDGNENNNMDMSSDEIENSSGKLSSPHTSQSNSYAEEPIVCLLGDEEKKSSDANDVLWQRYDECVTNPSPDERVRRSNSSNLTLLPPSPQQSESFSSTASNTHMSVTHGSNRNSLSLSISPDKSEVLANRIQEQLKTPDSKSSKQVDDNAFSPQTSRVIDKSAVVYTGPMDYCNLSIKDNLETYFRVQVFGQGRPSGASPYLRCSVGEFLKEIDDNEAVVPCEEFVPPPRKPEQVLGFYYEESFEKEYNEQLLPSVASAESCLYPLNGHNESHRLEESSRLIFILTDLHIYVVLDEFTAGSTFLQAPVPLLHRLHPLETLRSCTLYFGFQRCSLHFHDMDSEDSGTSQTVSSPGPVVNYRKQGQSQSLSIFGKGRGRQTRSSSVELRRPGSCAVFVYMLLTKDKARTHPILTTVLPAANRVRSNVKPHGSLVGSPSPRKGLPNVEINNKDSQFLDQVSLLVHTHDALRGKGSDKSKRKTKTKNKTVVITPPRHDSYIGTLPAEHVQAIDVEHVQLLYQIWRQRKGYHEARTLVLTPSFFLLCEEALDKEDVHLTLLDRVAIKDVYKILADDDPLAFTFVLSGSAANSSNKVTRSFATRKWRLKCETRSQQAKCLEEARRIVQEKGGAS